MGMGRRNLTKVRLVSSVILSVVGEGLRGKHVRVPPSIERGMPRPRPHSSPSSLCGIKGEGEGEGGRDSCSPSLPLSLPHSVGGSPSRRGPMKGNVDLSGGFGVMIRALHFADGKRVRV